ncbi:MAG: low molecular weight protein arginine phosphatase [Bacilli bacterium]|nr:low molecular weight protein arginine phosphatase [Bacilli bacterium]
MNILFVCTGNTCRSPMAAAMLKKKAPHLSVQSAGVFASDNLPASEQAIKAMDQKGIELKHKSQMVTESLVEWADLVLTMTEQHKKQLNHLFPEHTTKIYSLVEYAADGKQKDINDPFGGDVSLYVETADEIEVYIDLLIEKLQNLGGQNG